MLKETLLLAMTLPLLACTNSGLPRRSCNSSCNGNWPLWPIGWRRAPSRCRSAGRSQQAMRQRRRRCASSWLSGWRLIPGSSSPRPGKVTIRCNSMSPCSRIAAVMPEAGRQPLPAPVWCCAINIVSKAMASTGPEVLVMTAVVAPSMPARYSASIRARPSRPRNSRRPGSKS